MPVSSTLTFQQVAGDEISDELVLAMRKCVGRQRGEKFAEDFTARHWPSICATSRSIVAIHDERQIGFLHYRTEEQNGILDIGFVLPEYANRDIENELIGRTIEAFPSATRLIFSGPFSSWVASLGVDNYSSALRQRGFSLFYYLILSADPRELTLPGVPDFSTSEVKFESFSDGYLDLCARIMAAAPDETIKLLRLTAEECKRWILFPKTERPADHPPDLSFVALVGGYPIGFIACRTLESGGAWLGQLFILPEYQGRGIGKILLTNTLHGCRNRGLSGVSLAVSEHNAAALKLYRRVGFVEIARLPRWYKILTRPGRNITHL